MLLGAGIVGRWTFGADTHRVTLMLLAIPVMAGALAMANGTILQGLHKMVHLTRLNVWGALAGVVIGVPLIFTLGMRGVVWILITTSLAGLALSSVAVRQLGLSKTVVPRNEIVARLTPLLGLGVLFGLNSIANSLTGWLVRVYVLRTIGLEALGSYQAAVNLSGLCAGFVMQTMYMEYFPRLASATNRDVINRSINEQLVITVLMTVPAMMATLVFAPLVIRFFYAESFLPAVPVLKWCLGGVAIRLAAWPLGLAVQAKGSLKWVLVADMLGYGTTVLVLLPACRRFGTVGAAMAMCAGAAVYGVAACLVTRRIHAFRCDSHACRHLIVGVFFLAFGEVVSWLCSDVMAMAVSVPALVLISLYALFSMAEIAPGGWLSRFAGWFGFERYLSLKNRLKRMRSQ
jgi:PST family polysaccharide transporter